MAQALFRRARGRNYSAPRIDERHNAASTLAQFGYLLTGVLLDLDQKRSDFRMCFDNAFELIQEPVAADGKLYFSSEDGDVFVARAGRKYELMATNVMGQPVMATPAISDGLLIVRTKDFVYAIGER